MSRFRKLTQTIWHCQYHIVWVPKYRFRILNGKVAVEVANCIRAFSKQKECDSDMIRKYVKYQEKKEKRAEQQDLFEK